MLWAMLAIGLPAALAGAALFAMGLRGRRIDDHPICRRCGFDLIGQEKDGASPALCSDCGASLHEPGAVRIGQRCRRAGMAGAGASFLLLALVALSWGGIIISRAADPQALKPMWLLLKEADRGDRPAFMEISRRATAGELTPKELSDLADNALERRERFAERWFGPGKKVTTVMSVERHRLSAWLELFELIAAIGGATTEQVIAYARDGMTFGMHQPETVAPEAMMRVLCVAGDAGAQIAGPSSFTARVRTVSATLGGAALSLDDGDGATHRLGHVFWWASSAVTMAPGDYPLRVRWQVSVLSATGRELATFEVARERTISIAQPPAAEPQAEARAEPEHAP